MHLQMKKVYLCLILDIFQCVAVTHGPRYLSGLQQSARPHLRASEGDSNVWHGGLLQATVLDMQVREWPDWNMGYQDSSLNNGGPGWHSPEHPNKFFAPVPFLSQIGRNYVYNMISLFLLHCLIIYHWLVNCNHNSASESTQWATVKPNISPTVCNSSSHSKYKEYETFKMLSHSLFHVFSRSSLFGWSDRSLSALWLQHHGGHGKEKGSQFL